MISPLMMVAVAGRDITMSISGIKGQEAYDTISPCAFDDADPSTCDR